MALAIGLDYLIKSGQVTNQAELAPVGHICRARITQGMDLNLLAPDIQGEILVFGDSVTAFTVPIERSVRRMAKMVNRGLQRRAWKCS